MSTNSDDKTLLPFNCAQRLYGSRPNDHALTDYSVILHCNSDCDCVWLLMFEWNVGQACQPVQQRIEYRLQDVCAFIIRQQLAYLAEMQAYTHCCLPLSADIISALQFMATLYSKLGLTSLQNDKIWTKKLRCFRSDAVELTAANRSWPILTLFVRRWSRATIEPRRQLKKTAAQTRCRPTYLPTTVTTFRYQNWLIE